MLGYKNAEIFGIEWSTYSYLLKWCFTVMRDNADVQKSRDTVLASSPKIRKDK